MIMSNKNLENWHNYLAGKFEGGLDELLHDDCVFISPIVFSPQKGKDLTKMYLGAAGNTFSEGDKDKAPGQKASNFRYIKEVVDGNQMVLEFETTIEDKYVNGVDIITFDDDGKITEFKVMIRPLQAINMMHAKMKAMIESMMAQSAE